MEVAQPPSSWNFVEIPDRVKDRAFTRWQQEGECWISNYSVASHGYAQVGWQHQDDLHVVLAHRASWERTNGPVPVGHTLDHVCKNKRCVNPDHLRVLTNFENARRTDGRNWKLGFCANGHSDKYLIDTSRRTKGGKPRTGKRCSMCNTMQQARHRWRKKHPGEQMPEVLLLASEKLSMTQAA